MRDLPVPPYDLALNTTMQTVATVVLWWTTQLLVRQRQSLPTGSEPRAWDGVATSLVT